MKESLELIGFILCVTMVFIIAMFVSNQVKATTPIEEDPPFPPAIEDQCWYAGVPPLCPDHESQ